MATRLGRGHCGAHLTLLFTVDDDAEEHELQGSTGSGICLEDGVEAIARGEDGLPSLDVSFLGEEYDQSMYEEVLNVLGQKIPEVRGLSWELSIRMALPASQGFGMSASGAVAAAMAFQRAIGTPNEECVRRSFLVAHIVERRRSSGLGDTTALAAGGVERRTVAGSPYSRNLLSNGPGESEGWASNTPVLLCWRSKTGTHTSKYINDETWKKKISIAGKNAMSSLGKGAWDSSRWMDLIESSKRFSEESGLLGDSSRGTLVSLVEQAVFDCGLGGDTSVLLCMLGESAVVVPNDWRDGDEKLEMVAKLLDPKGVKSQISRVGGRL